MTITQPVTFKKIPTLEVLRASYPGIRAYFFDMDGTLFNTEIFHTQAFLKIGQDNQIIPPHSPDVIHKMLVGKADHLVFEVVKDWKNFPKTWTAQDFVTAKTKNLLMLLENTSSDNYLPQEMRNLLSEIKSEGKTLALVTSSEKSVTLKLLSMAGLENQFDFILTRDDCPEHKPHPWPYLKAQEKAKTEAGACLVFEDSEVGITAARSSGSHVIKAQWYD